MKIIRRDEHQSQQGTTFTGEVIQERILTPQTEGGLSISIVHFKDGARTHWHEHPGEQVLYILEGEGRVGNDREEFRVQPGDVVYEGPGEPHWHGAAPGQSMSHISITTVGSPTWFDPPEE